MRLCFDHDLMLRIHRGDARVALDHPFARRHFRARIIGAITLANRPTRARSIRRMCRQPLTHLLGIALQFGDARLRFRCQIRLNRQAVRFAVPCQHRRRGRFQFGRLLFEIGTRPTPVFRRITRQLHPINRKHLVTDQPLSVADREHRRQYFRDRVIERADKVRDRREMRRRVSAERDERHVVLARPLDAPTADDALRVCEQHHP